MLRPHTMSPMVGSAEEVARRMANRPSNYGVGSRSVDPALNNAPLEFGKPRIANHAVHVVEIGSDTEDDSSEQSNTDDERHRHGNQNQDRDYRHRDRDDRWERFRERIERNDKQNSQRSKSPIPRYLDNHDMMPSSTVGTIPIDSLQQQWPIMYPVMGVSDPAAAMMGVADPTAAMMGVADPTGAMMGMVPMNYSQPSLTQYNYLGQVQPDPTLSSIVPIVPGMAAGPVKEIIHCKSCTLFPPNSGAPPQTTRVRPPGCKTVFVGGLPENITEEILREIFERCGGIFTIRTSKKNFCHLRFESEIYVDNAIYLSGYQIRIGSNTDTASCGRLHVDYASARDDSFEYECLQRKIQREQRHMERMEQEKMRPKSPPLVTHYSDHEASLLTEKIKVAANNGTNNSAPGVENNFPKAMHTLITWLERGDCSKKNCGQFYSMIQSSNSHVRRLMAEKSHYEEELVRAKEQINYRMQGIIAQFNQIEKVFTAASHQKVWDHFTKAQRKNIDAWKKQIQEMKNARIESSLSQRVEDEMDFSDDDSNQEPGAKKMRFDVEAATEQISGLSNQVNNLKEENDSLRCQVEAYKNEVDLIKSESHQEIEEKNKQIKSLQQALQGMQQQLIQANQLRTKEEGAIQNRQKILKSDKDSSTSDEHASESAPSSSDIPFLEAAATSVSPPKIAENEAKLIGLLATFLHVHPFGASVDYICSYLQRIDASLKPSDVETLLHQFPTVFRVELTGVGASLERKWIFTGFHT